MGGRLLRPEWLPFVPPVHSGNRLSLRRTSAHRLCRRSTALPNRQFLPHPQKPPVRLWKYDEDIRKQARRAFVPGSAWNHNIRALWQTSLPPPSSSHSYLVNSNPQWGPYICRSPLPRATLSLIIACVLSSSYPLQSFKSQHDPSLYSRIPPQPIHILILFAHTTQHNTAHHSPSHNSHASAHTLSAMHL